jgi:hypothetical protein
VALYELLEKIGKQDLIYLYIKSSGGDGRASLRLVNLLRQYCNRLIALVPLECASAATMITLGADEIMMGPMAYLTPVDTSLTHDLSPLDRDNARVSVSLNELTRVIGLWRAEQAESRENPYKALFQYVHPLVIGAVDRIGPSHCRSCCARACWLITSTTKPKPIKSRGRSIANIHRTVTPSSLKRRNRSG